MKAVACMCLATVLALLGAHRYVRDSAVAAAPLRFYFADLSADAADGIGVWIVDDRDKEAQLERIAGSPFWSMDAAWVANLVVRLPEKELPNITRLIISIGDEDVLVSGVEFRSWNRQATQALLTLGKLAPDEVAVMMPDKFAKASSLPWIPPLLNWPGDFVYLRSVGQHALPPLLLVLLLGFWQWRKSSPQGLAWSRYVLGLEAPPVEQPESARCWDWLGLLFLVGALAFLEVRQPYYFVQCDTLVDILPQVIVGCRGVWRGEFPDYNPYVLLGSPLASLGFYSLTYPPLYAAYALARHGLGDEYAVADVFAIAHLLAGFLVSRLLARKLGMGALAANLAALSYVLSGPWLIMGRSWLNFVPLVVWLPALFLGLARLQAKPVSWKWIVGMGLASGLPFHVGFSQMAIYPIGFFCLAVVFLLLTGMLTWERAAAVVPALLLGAALAMPIVYQQWLAAQGLTRSRLPGIDRGMTMGLPAMLLPYPLAEALLPTRWGTAEVHVLGHFYFFGGVLAVLFVAQAAGLLVLRPRRSQWAGQVWTVCGLCALWLGLGDGGGLWEIATRLPLLGFINRHPMRLMPFVAFFGCFAGALVLDRLLRRQSSGLVSSRLAVWREPLVAGAALALLGLHVFQCHSAFLLFDFQPYARLPESWQFHRGDQSTGRIQCWTRHNSPHIDYGKLLALNIAGIHEVPSLGGLNSLLQEKAPLRYLKLNLAALRTYGVRWHILFSPEAPLGSAYCVSWVGEATSKNESFFRQVASEKWPIAYQPDGAALAELADVAPLAFSLSNPSQTLRLKMHSRGVDVEIDQLTGSERVVVNFLYYADMRAYVDDVEVPCFADAWNRVVVSLPGQGTLLSVRYRPPWLRAVGLGLAVGFVALVAAVVLRKSGRQ